MKILVIRFSSIGDIVLTSPVVRCLKQAFPDAQIHFLTKKQYSSILRNNPYVDKIYTVSKSLSEVIKELKSEKYDYIIDLHKNLRTKLLLLLMWRRAHSFNKLNKKKWLRVNLKINLLPKLHIVDRYMKTVRFLGVKNDNKGLDYFIPPNDEVDLKIIGHPWENDYLVIVIGAKQATKQIPAEQIIRVCQNLTKPVILLGGEEDAEKADEIVNALPEKSIYNSCGKYNINQSASLIKQASVVITADTGMMHIAAAFKKEIISVWGNTIPEFGMYPYLPPEKQHLSHIIELKGLPCRPCTKLGFNNCPRGHFMCMIAIDENEILKWIK